jgi:hypothetical protein
MSKHRYALLVGLLLVLMLFHTVRGVWVSDFWEHAAVVRELATHPLSPYHPLLLSDAPHAFFSPYALVLASASRVLGSDAVSTLAAAGIANLVLLLIGLRWFVGAIFKGDRDAISFYFLLFLLVLWGRAPWFWSGFLHFGALGHVLPYPSTFAAALMFGGLAAYARHLQTGRTRWVLPLFPLLWVCFLTHPTTALGSVVGLIAVFIGFAGRPSARGVLLLLALCALPLLATSAWPYFDYPELLLHPTLGFEFHDKSRLLYTNVFGRIFPALAGVPILALRLRDDRRDALAWLVFGLFAVYVLGALSSSWGAGRVMGQLVMFLQLAIAVWVAQLETRLPRLRFAALLTVLAAVALWSGNAAWGWRQVTGSVGRAHRYHFLSEYVGQYDVVLTDLSTAVLVSTFGGKIVASQHPLYWIDDHEERRRAVSRFFSGATPLRARRRIIARYGAKFVLLDSRRVELTQRASDDLSRLGDLVYDGKGMQLIALHPLEPGDD